MSSAPTGQARSWLCQRTTSAILNSHKSFTCPFGKLWQKKFVQSKEPGAYREGEPITEKDGIIAIIKHWSEDKYMGLAWKQVKWGTFLTGGVDRGSTPEETVLKRSKKRPDISIQKLWKS